MTTARTAIDPLWQCLCPSWKQQSLIQARAFLLARPRRPAAQCLNLPTPRQDSRPFSRRAHETDHEPRPSHRRRQASNQVPYPEFAPQKVSKGWSKGTDTSHPSPRTLTDLTHLSLPDLYSLLTTSATSSDVPETQRIAESLVTAPHHQPPSPQLYNALILSHTLPSSSAQRVHELLEEMEAGSIPLDAGTLHAVLKVLAVHPDHLLRADVLREMRRRWIPLSEEGAHDVVAGLLREGLLEQALAHLDALLSSSSSPAHRAEPWLLDMACFALCDAGEVAGAYDLLAARLPSPTGLGPRAGAVAAPVSRELWAFFLDHAAAASHHAAVLLAWNSQVAQGYLNPPSGTVMQVLATASRAGDAALATEAFAKLSAGPEASPGMASVRYALLADAYLAAEPPDLTRALGILGLMPVAGLVPAGAETRGLFAFLAERPEMLGDAVEGLRGLKSANPERAVPVAVVNAVMEAHVAGGDLGGAMRVYKIMHALVEGEGTGRRGFADAETFGCLLKGCRLKEPVAVETAEFLIGEMKALRVRLDATTYDRLILVYLKAAQEAVDGTRGEEGGEGPTEEGSRAREMLDTAFRHFTDMLASDLLPRYGTLEALAVQSAALGDERCWDVLQFADERGHEIESFAQKGRWIRADVEKTWEKAGGRQEGTTAAAAN